MSKGIRSIPVLEGEDAKNFLIEMIKTQITRHEGKGDNWIDKAARSIYVDLYL